ncbi:hypothetical protein TDB9533_00129 [Thalassocella blandensis]|nr:hypothetical protein TDB9533_00129 [Thalassocella blandensis]
MSDDVTEKRRKHRADVDQHIDVVNTMTNQSLGKVVNISEDGFMLIGSGEIKENCLYQLRFSFTVAIDGVSHIDLGAECLWWNETGAGEQVWAGFHVIDIAQKDRDLMHELSDDVS